MWIALLSPSQQSRAFQTVQQNCDDTGLVQFYLGANAVCGRAPHLTNHVEGASGVSEAALDVQVCFPIFIGDAVQVGEFAHAKVFVFNLDQASVGSFQCD